MEKKSSKTQKLKNFQKKAKICDTPFAQRSLIHQEAWFPPCFVKQNQPKKKLFFFVLRFYTTSKAKCTNLRPLLLITFPQGISKNIGHPTLGSGGKKTFKRYLKSDKETDAQTDGHFDLQKPLAQRADALKTKLELIFLPLHRHISGDCIKFSPMIQKFTCNSKGHPQFKRSPVIQNYTYIIIQKLTHNSKVHLLFKRLH